jgi:hypothetical protein
MQLLPCLLSNKTHINSELRFNTDPFLNDIFYMSQAQV